MATERQSPNAIIELSASLVGTVNEIQDDPDSPDANWLDAQSNNADTYVRVGFPTPTGNPTVGAGLQEFRAQVRKFDGTGTPTARLELYEGGSLIRAGNENNITGTTVISFTWNANEIGTADGSLVECRIYGTKTGGSPSARSTVEVGAVEWNVTYDSGVTEWVAGVINGAASVSGSNRISRKIAGVPVGVAAVNVVARIERGIAGVVSAFASVSASVKPSRGLSGVVSGIASAVGTVSTGAIEFLEGAISGVCSISGATKIIKKVSSVTSGFASVSGAAKVLRGIGGEVDGLSSVSISVAISKKIAGAISGAGSVAGNLVISAIGVALAGISSGIAVVASKLSYHRVLKVQTNLSIHQNGDIKMDIKRALNLSASFRHGLELQPDIEEK